MHSKVAVAKCDRDMLDACIDQAQSLIGGLNLKENAKIFIKPNLCCLKSSENGVTTDVKLVEAVIAHIRKQIKNSEIIIVESENSGESGKGRGTADDAFRLLGYNELAEKYDICLCNLNKEPTVKKQIPKGKKLKTLEVPKILLSMDYFISIAKMKRHSIERYTGVWKNQYGLIPNRKLRLRLHPFLSEALFDLNYVFRPDLGIIDAITALEGPSEVEGTPKKMNLIICSKNPLSADIVAAKIMGENARSIPHIKYALAHGFKDAENPQVVGEMDVIANKTKFQFVDDRKYLRMRMELYYKKLRCRLGI